MSHQGPGGKLPHTAQKLPIAGASITESDINQNLYKPGSGITNFIKEIKTIYQDLTKDNDLVACMALHKT